MEQHETVSVSQVISTSYLLLAILEDEQLKQHPFSVGRIIHKTIPTMSFKKNHTDIKPPLKNAASRHKRPYR